ncbi:hypothetical protein RRG08_063276 [Elysia crispata]|uniref:Uncharacterized protein n=1 Tax=Elysia crispata TaxID=231223 RepID=A0AAE0XP40_9GAST|nr:hypothetical protein RRG08_063276 [Elysia crispata]
MYPLLFTLLTESYRIQKKKNSDNAWNSYHSVKRTDTSRLSSPHGDDIDTKSPPRDFWQVEMAITNDLT